jgi:UDP:flavonoid glycosyltransferase YjiC (YdhE family)
MKVLFTSLREKSHFLPLIPFIQACQRAGHSVAVAAPPDLVDQVAKTGATFLPFGHPGDAGLQHIWARFRELPPEGIRRVSVADLFADACAGAALPGLLESIEHWRPSIVLSESFEYAGALAAEKHGVPFVRIAICARGAELDNDGLASEAVDRHRGQIGLEPDPTGERLRDARCLTLFPPSYEAVDAASPRITRYRATQSPPASLPSWWGERPGPFVYVTLGTVAGGFELAHVRFRAALEALEGLPVRALLTTGHSLPDDVLGHVPSNVYVQAFVPQDDVLPHADVVLCHGGSGTVLGALAAGVPMVVAPIFADQPHNALCVQANGSGLGMPQSGASPAELRAALLRVLQEPSFRATARRFAQDMASLPTLDDAARDIERLSRGEP